jgi:hypothetical protein
MRTNDRPRVQRIWPATSHISLYNHLTVHGTLWKLLSTYQEHLNINEYTRIRSCAIEIYILRNRRRTLEINTPYTDIVSYNFISDEDHISNQRDANFYAHLLIATLTTCFGRHSPIIRSSETVCAVYGTMIFMYKDARCHEHNINFWCHLCTHTCKLLPFCAARWFTTTQLINKLV